MAETKDTMFGLLRRTGPASAELFDPETGAVYALNYAAFADTLIGPMDGREILNETFLPEPPESEHQ